MRVARSCVAAATALLSTARHAEAAERTAGGTGLVAAGGNDQQPLMPASPEDNEHGDDLLRGLLDIMQLDLGQTEPDAGSRDFKSCAACEVRLFPFKGLVPCRAQGGVTVPDTYRRLFVTRPS